MTLEECFKIYKDEDKMIRKNKVAHPFQNRPDTVKRLKEMFPTFDSSRISASIGFMIPKFMIEDNEASDWELFDGNNESYLVSEEEEKEIEKMIESFLKIKPEKLYDILDEL